MAPDSADRLALAQVQSRLNEQNPYESPLIEGEPNQTGRVLDYQGKPNRKMCSLFLSLLDKYGVAAKEFGDSTEPLAEI